MIPGPRAARARERKDQPALREKDGVKACHQPGKGDQTQNIGACPVEQRREPVQNRLARLRQGMGADAFDRRIDVDEKERGQDDRARAEALVFRLARQERDAWVTWPNRVAALMAAEVALGVEKQTGAPVIIEAAILQRVLEAHVRQHLDDFADLRVSLG